MNLPYYLSTDERRSCQRLFLGTVRHKGFLDHVLGLLMPRKPKPHLGCLLKVAFFETLFADSDKKVAQAVHGAVQMAKEYLSKPEAQCVNAVLRKWVQGRDVLRMGLCEREDLLAWSYYYSHPLWLIEHWVALWGSACTRNLLHWNQKEPRIYVRLLDNTLLNEGGETFLEASSWKGFYVYKGDNWSSLQQALNEGRLYIQDPSTRIAPNLLPPLKGKRILDLCAAPGGKTGMLAALVGEQGRVLAVDRPGRTERLKENIKRFRWHQVDVLERDLMVLDTSTLKRYAFDAGFEAVFIDVPCSNTGVLQRRPDAKWRLIESDFKHLPRQQNLLLNKAASWVLPGGFLVYSTCSIEGAENKEVVDSFLSEHPSFALLQGQTHYPWDTGHDGCGAYLLQKV